MSERTYDPNDPADNDLLLTVDGLWAYNAVAGRWELQDPEPTGIAAEWSAAWVSTGMGRVTGIRDETFTPRWSSTTAAASAAATRVRVKEPEVFTLDDLVMVTRTGELMLVEAVESEWLIVERAVGREAGMTAVPLKVRDELLLVGNKRTMKSSG